MNMNSWNTEKQFSNSTNTRTNINPKWIQFNSEIAIRKGSEGWIINARFDNLYSSLQNSLVYMLTTYKYEDNKWQKNEETKLWVDSEVMSGISNMIWANGGYMQTHSETLVIKSPEGTWFNDSDWVSEFNSSQAGIKKYVGTKSWSGVWIDDENKGTGSWIFQDIELYISDKKYSQVFCKGEKNNCFQSSSTSGGKIKKTEESETWSETIEKGRYNGEKVKEVIPKTVEEIIGKLQDSKGSWKKLEDICEVDGDPSEEQKNQLRMYCSKGKAN